MTTLILMACSDVKRPTERPIPAWQLYDGPLWRTLRTHAGDDFPWHQVLVLSAKYGLINAMSYISPYDMKLSAAKADWLIARGIDWRNDRFGAIRKGATGCSPRLECGAHRIRYQRAWIVGAGHYRRVFDWLCDELLLNGLGCREGAATRFGRHYVSGGIGEQRKQLGEWLRGHESGLKVVADPSCEAAPLANQHSSQLFGQSSARGGRDGS